MWGPHGSFFFLLLFLSLLFSPILSLLFSPADDPLPSPRVPTLPATRSPPPAFPPEGGYGVPEAASSCTWRSRRPPKEPRHQRPPPPPSTLPDPCTWPVDGERRPRPQVRLLRAPPSPCLLRRGCPDDGHRRDAEAKVVHRRGGRYWVRLPAARTGASRRDAPVAAARCTAAATTNSDGGA